jgi:putative oxidoreductase
MRQIRWLLFGGAGGGSATADVGLLLLRVFAGLSLALAHGIGKLPPSERFLAGVAEMGFPLPIVFGWAAALSEFAGGILIALGLLIRPAALFVAITMAVAAFIRQAGDPFGERELALLYGTMAVMLLLTGAGRYAMDARVRGRN